MKVLVKGKSKKSFLLVSDDGRRLYEAKIYRRDRATGFPCAELFTVRLMFAETPKEVKNYFEGDYPPDKPLNPKLPWWHIEVELCRVDASKDKVPS